MNFKHIKTLLVGIIIELLFKPVSILPKEFVVLYYRERCV